MKKIAVITSGLLPMPAVKDGAIETLLQYVLDYNEINFNYQFDVYSIYNQCAYSESKKYKRTNFYYITINQFLLRISTFVFKVLRKLKIISDPNFQFEFIRKVYNKMKMYNYDYIIVESENHFAKYLLKKGFKNVILYLHNDKLNAKIKNADFILENALEIWTVSEYLKDCVITINPSLETKVKVILNGIDIYPFQCIKKEKHDGVNYLYVGRIEESKGVLELIKAFNKLNDSSASLYIAGGSFHSSSKKTKYLKKVIIEASKGKNIYFLGHVPHNKLSKIYSIIDVQIVPSVWQEPAGLVNIEAISSGVKLIASDVGGIKEYVDDHTTLVKYDCNFIYNLYEAMKNKDSNDSYDERKFNINYYSKDNYSKRVINQIKKLEEK